MKGVHHDIAQSEPDAMGQRTQIKISIPLPKPNSAEEVRHALADTQSGLSAAFEKAEEHREQGFPRNIREAHQWANEVADGDAELHSKSYEMFVVAQGLKRALDYLEDAAAEIKQDFEQALNVAFTAGSNFRLAVSRERHLEDLERELSQAKARERGRDETRRITEGCNRELFIFMLKRLKGNGDGKKPSVMEVARAAAEEGLGAKTGDLEKNAQANRSRFNRWVRTKRGG